MDTYIGYLTTTIDVTQRSAETIGEAFKTVFRNLKIFLNFSRTAYVQKCA